MSNQQRIDNLAIGGAAAGLLSRMWRHAESAQTQLKDMIAYELHVSPATVARWANGSVAVPKERRELLLDCLRAFRWQIDKDWTAATAFSEMLGIDGRDFAEVRKYAFDGETTQYRIVRFDGAGNLVIGRVLIENLKDKPLIWKYFYEAKSDFGEKTERAFRGPILKSGKSIYAILSGGTTGREKYLRVESIWPRPNPDHEITFGVSLSTYIDRGMPMSSPFALISEKLYLTKFETDDQAKLSLTEKLLGMAGRGIIAPVS